MAIPIKIECDCGQRYAFDIEPVNGQMPSAVACPACGADGTTTANEIISQQIPAAPAASPIRRIDSPNPIRPIAPAAPATTISAAPTSVASITAARISRLQQVDPKQMEHEARAKIMWGDSTDEVIKYLMIQGMNRNEALNLAQILFQERAATIRANGIRKIIVGSGLMCVPIIALLIFLHIGVIPMKLFGLTIMVGLYGAYLVLKGILMALAPKSELGDVSEQ